MQIRSSDSLILRVCPSRIQHGGLCWALRERERRETRKWLVQGAKGPIRPPSGLSIKAEIHSASLPGRYRGQANALGHSGYSKTPEPAGPPYHAVHPCSTMIWPSWVLGKPLAPRDFKVFCSTWPSLQLTCVLLDVESLELPDPRRMPESSLVCLYWIGQSKKTACLPSWPFLATVGRVVGWVDSIMIKAESLFGIQLVV